MKKLTAFTLVIVMLFALVSCGGYNADTIKKNLENAGYTATAGSTEKLDSLGLENMPKEVVVGTSKIVNTITVYIFESADDAEAAKEAYSKGSLGLGDIMKNGVKNNAFYIATTDAAVEAAFG